MNKTGLNVVVCAQSVTKLRR